MKIYTQKTKRNASTDSTHMKWMRRKDIYNTNGTTFRGGSKQINESYGFSISTKRLNEGNIFQMVFCEWKL